MQITIDTQKDSKEHIRKAINFLQQFTGEDQEIVTPQVGSFNLFNDDKPKETKPDIPKVELF